MEGDATPAQLAVIAKWGYDVTDTHYSMSQIAEIFGQQPCTEKQKYALGKAGYDVSGFVSVSHANAAFKEIKEREDKARINNNNNNIKNNLPFKF